MEEWRIGDLPTSFECPACGTKNFRTDAFCRKCEKPLEETKAQLAKKALASHENTQDRAKRPSEKRIALIPKVTTQRWSGFGWEVMEGSIVLTDKRIVFVPDEIGANTTLMAAAGALGGMIGALAAAATAKTPSEESRDPNRPLDEIIASSKRVLEMRYDNLEHLECKHGSRILQITIRNKPMGHKSSKVKLILAMPDGFLAARMSEGMDKKRAWEEYCTRCRTAFESSMTGKGVNLTWTK